jgi:hypothetical protein
MNPESNEKLTRPSMLPASWVDRIFSVMLAHYGARFSDMWRDTDIADVKAVWAEKLSGFHDRPDCLKYGLDCLVGHPFPPSLPEFLADCRRAQRQSVVSIDHKLSVEDIARNRARLKSISDNLFRRKFA